MSIQTYQDLIQGQLASFLSLSNQIGDEVAEQAKLVYEAFKAQLDFLVQASQRSIPSNEVVMHMLKSTCDKIQSIQNLRENNRASTFFNHLSAISESIPALGWVTVSPAPAPYIKEMNDAGQFYANRVLKEWKEKNKVHVDWAKCWTDILSELQKFVKQHHTTGLVWAGSRSGGVPPPPPGNLPPPPPIPDLASLAVGAGNDDRSALFAEINQGEGITRTLKKTTPDMQTHKNPNLRTGPAPFKPPAGSNSPSGIKPAIEKPPVFKRDGKKWIIEYYKDNHGLLVDGTEMNNVIYMYSCTNCTLTVKGKVLGKVPTISIDKTDGCQIYLNDQSLDVEIISSKSSEMNVLVPKGAGEYLEYPIPEQYKTTVSKTGLKTAVIESKG